MRKVAVAVGAAALAVGLVAMSRRFDWEAQTVWSAVGALTTGLAAGVAVYLAWVEQQERSKRRADEERAQASRVTLRLDYPSGGHSEGNDWVVTSAIVSVWNMSDMPVTEVSVTVTHVGELKPGAPPSFTREWAVVMPDEQDIVVPVAFRVPIDKTTPEGFRAGTVSSELTFTDSAGRKWKRQHNQRLTLVSAPQLS